MDSCENKFNITKDLFMALNVEKSTFYCITKMAEFVIIKSVKLY